MFLSERKGKEESAQPHKAYYVYLCATDVPTPSKISRHLLT